MHQYDGRVGRDAYVDIPADIRLHESAGDCVIQVPRIGPDLDRDLLARA